MATSANASLPVMKEFARDYNVRPMYGRQLMLDVLLSSYEEYLGRKPERAPRIAITGPSAATRSS